MADNMGEGAAEPIVKKAWVVVLDSKGEEVERVAARHGQSVRIDIWYGDEREPATMREVPI